MNLTDLSARELARIDAICLDFETALRSGGEPSVDAIVAERGGQHADLLRQELEAVRQEVESEKSPVSMAATSTSELSGTASLAPQPDRTAQAGADRPEARPRAGGDSAAEQNAADNAAARMPANGRPRRRLLPSRGERVGPYVIGRQLGRGGMGAVFEALDTRLGRTVAIKVLAVDAERREELADRFQREARAVAALSHPNIVELFDVGTAAGIPYAVMEFLDGETLLERFRRGPLPSSELRRIAAQISDALAAAHDGGVVHRDLKPHNIMLVPRHGSDPLADCEPGGTRTASAFEAPGGSDLRDSGSDSRSSRPSAAGRVDETRSAIVKLFDFGLSRSPRTTSSTADTSGTSGQEDLLGRESGSDASSGEDSGDDARTRAGMILGTPGYMSPEQARGEPVTAAADIFALGCILYEGYYGTRAFDGETPTKRFAAVLETAPTGDPRRREADPELAELIDQCLAKEVAQRPASAAEISHRLRSVRRVTPAGHAAERAAPAPSRRVFFESLAGGLVGAVAGSWFTAGSGSELARVRSIGVLPFEDGDADNPERAVGGPIGGRPPNRGELLAGLLVNELSGLEGITVPKFQPIYASTPEDFRRVGRQLEVDALVTATYRTIPKTAGSGTYLQIEFQIISTTNGKQLHGDTITVDAGDYLPQQSRMASDIAAAIGRTLAQGSSGHRPARGDAFNCLVKGSVVSDPDSLEGLEAALACYQHANQEDPRYPEPYAGIALTSMTLAAQSADAESQRLVAEARTNVEQALKLSPGSVDARLAEAMLNWQVHWDYDQAARTLRELAVVAPNHWQVSHQYGLLLLVLGQPQEAIRRLLRASQLHPMSVTLKVDLARARWFGGDRERAIDDAKFIRDEYEGSDAASGLLIDIYEGAGQFRLAAHQDGVVSVTSDSAADYFDRRRNRLGTMPYGPFGPALNRAILDQREAVSAGGDRGGAAATRLRRLVDRGCLMLPLLLACHPAFASLTRLAPAKDLLAAGD